MEILIDILLLISLTTGIIGTTIVVMDCHKRNKLIQEIYKRGKKND